MNSDKKGAGTIFIFPSDEELAQALGAQPFSIDDDEGKSIEELAEEGILILPETPIPLNGKKIQAIGEVPKDETKIEELAEEIEWEEIDEEPDN